MKHLLIIFFTFLAIFACKKKETEEETPIAEPPANGVLAITINSFDTLGMQEPNTYSTSVFLSGTAYSSATDASGKVSFTIPSGTYYPSVIRSKYEAFPFSANVTSNNTTSVTSAVYQNSTYSVQIANPSASSSAINLTFNLDKAVPFGKSVKVAVLYGTNTSLSVNSYSVVETFTTSTQSSTHNVYTGAIQTAINQLPVNTQFYLMAVPCSYGNYFSTILNKNILVGDYLPPVGVSSPSVTLTKTW